MAYLSVIIPTFDRPEQTCRAVASVIGQGLGHELEVIVVDDGSRVPLDPANGILADARVRVIHRSSNGGAAAARNTGVAAARGDWLSFLDSDDWLLPGTLAARLEFAQHQAARWPEQMVACVCGFLDVSSAGTVARVRIPRGAAHLNEFASGCWFSPGSCLLMRRQDALALGPQDETLRRLEDLDWFLRFGRAGGRLAAQHLVGTALAIGHHATGRAIDAAACRITEIWLSEQATSPLPGSAGRRLRAYLDLVKGVTALHERRWSAAAFCLARSLARRPRLRAQLCPGWQCLDPRSFADSPADGGHEPAGAPSGSP